MQAADDPPATGRLTAPDALQYVFRGEDKRTPKELKRDGGFKPWQIQTVAEARNALRKMVDGGTLKQEAEAWCANKERKNGWFISTGVDLEGAYTHYKYKYCINVSTMKRREWSELNLAAVKGMLVYTDEVPLDNATQIAVILKLSRPREPLIMTPVPVENTSLKVDGAWLPPADWPEN